MSHDSHVLYNKLSSVAFLICYKLKFRLSYGFRASGYLSNVHDVCKCNSGVIGDIYELLI